MRQPTRRRAPAVLIALLSMAAALLIGGSVQQQANAAPSDIDLCVRVADKVGFSGGNLQTAVAVAMAESRCDYEAINTANPNGTIDRGLWQINSVHGVPTVCLFNPLCNAQHAYRISSGGTNWQPWYAYQDGLHLQFMDDAQAAIARYHGAPEDFTPDGIEDLVGVHGVDGDLYLFRGTGGTSDAVHDGVRMADAWTGMRLIASGDFTGDGRADVVGLSGQTADLYLYVGNGNGGFSSSKVIGNNWSQIRLITMGDFTGDGRDDVVALHGGTGDLYVYQATGSGSNLALGSVRQIGSAWTGMRLITSGDFDRDGRDDIVGVHSQTADLYLYRGTLSGIGNGAVIQSNWSQIRAISSIDFDNDGDDDIAAVNSANGVLYRYLGNGAGNIGGGTSIGSGWTNIRLLAS